MAWQLNGQVVKLLDRASGNCVMGVFDYFFEY
jgi:hypothetical protein